MTHIHPSHYKDQEAVSIESEKIAAQFLPSIGAKMCSLVYKPLGFELLVQSPGSRYLLQPYDGSYVAGECSGFDDMLPSIDICYYEGYPWQGTRIPDHGEVWSIPWEHAIEGDQITFATYGVRFPYRLEKWVRFAGEDSLRLDYRLTNLSPFDFDFMWAAHAMFNLEEGSELVLPAGVEKIVSVMSPSGALGRYGDEFPWPAFRLADGRQRDLRFLRPQASGEFEKYVVKGRMSEGRCALKYHRSNVTLSLSFPVEKVPYLAVLSNEGGWRDMYGIFIEPTTASFDRLDVARLHNEYSTVKARSTYEWYLTIGITAGTDR
ncbi:MAG: hypothetical protein IT330_08325 [Anaerolineae bacterium]|nr:hypothetical protein [Anaerolineae bacterium]